jgi:hypothetical protein
MLQKALFSTRNRALLLIASLIGSCFLTGCASWFERFYKPAPPSYGSPNHPEKAYALSEAMPRVPICGALATHYIGDDADDAMLPMLAPGLFSDILSASGASMTHLGAPPPTPQFVWSSDPDGDGKLLAQEGYVLIGTSSFLGPGLFFSQTQQGLGQAREEATAQGKKVGAAVVLLNVPFTRVCAVSGAGGASNPLEPRVLLASRLAQPHTTGTVFASYWAKASPAGT